MHKRKFLAVKYMRRYSYAKFGTFFSATRYWDFLIMQDITLAAVDNLLSRPFAMCAWIWAVKIKNMCNLHTDSFNEHWAVLLDICILDLFDFSRSCM